MARIPLETLAEAEGPAGPYDGAVPEAALWFLPEAAEGSPPAPVPRAARGRIDPRDWAVAQGALAAELARVALVYGALEERLGAGPPGWRHRLALGQAADLSWWAGDRVGAERLALWEALRLSGVQEDAGGLARAAWALRRLMAGAVPGQGADLAAFLGRQGQPEAAADLAGLMADLARLHPLTRGAALFQGWRLMAEGEEAARAIEAAVLAGCAAAAMGRTGAGFVPQAGLAAGRGGAAERLAAWLAGAERGILAALWQLDRIAAWQRKAAAALAGLQGRTPARLAALFGDGVMVSAALAETATGASRAAVQRNLALLQQRGLIREVTGQGRYRLWTARL